MFGLFVIVLCFGSDDEVLVIVNVMEYGFGSGLWINDLLCVYWMVVWIDVGMCWINCYKCVNLGSLFGGVGKLGYGCEMGFEVMYDYMEVCLVWVNVDGNVLLYFKC